MSIHVRADGAGGYRLFSPSNDLVGWVRGRVVGVTGFVTRDSAVDAAVNSYRVLALWLERQGLEPLPHATPNPHSDSPGHSFEIVLHGTVSEGRAIHAALIAVHAAHGRIDAADVTWPRQETHSAEMATAAATTHRQLEDR